MWSLGSILMWVVLVGVAAVLVAWIIFRIYFSEKYRHLRNMVEPEPDPDPDLQIQNKRR